MPLPFLNNFKVAAMDQEATSPGAAWWWRRSRPRRPRPSSTRARGQRGVALPSAYGIE
ncbi:hypothetical protein ACP4OV_018772 [Aristida adscensionis]